MTDKIVQIAFSPAGTRWVLTASGRTWAFSQVTREWEESSYPPGTSPGGEPVLPEAPEVPETEEPQFNSKAFFDSVRGSLFKGSFNQGQVDGLNLILETCSEAQLDPMVQQTAYVLATVYHETAQTMQPISEYGGSSARYAPWYGRGHVQLTWEENYQKQENKHGHRGTAFKVHEDRERALLPNVSAAICIYGMKDGDFTGKALGDYITPTGKCDYWNARRIVNGTDRAEMIKGYAEHFEQALRAGIGETA